MKGNAKVVVRANRDNQQRISVIMSLPTLASLPFKKAQTAQNQENAETTA